MARTKNNGSKQLNAMGGHNSRQRIVETIMASKKGVYVSELLSTLKIEPTLMSHHLAVLRTSDILESKREGKRVFYTINKKYMVKPNTFQFGKWTVCLGK
jgi:DNA-binding transcriptional ArsR family regulator